MSTNHTPNYNLCQWEATDQVLRADFNADNAKIDAALGSLEARVGMKQIYTTTTTEANFNYWFRLPEIDWTQWRRVVIDIRGATGSGENMSFCWTGAYGNRIDIFDPYWTELMLFPDGDPNRLVTMLYWSKNSGVFRGTNTFARFNTIAIIDPKGNEKLQAGSTLTIWGEPM